MNRFHNAFAKKTLHMWILNHRHHLYPSPGELKYLSEKCNLSLRQLRCWFANYRRRHGYKLKDRDYLESVHNEVNLYNVSFIRQYLEYNKILHREQLKLKDIEHITHHTDWSEQEIITFISNNYYLIRQNINSFSLNEALIALQLSTLY